MIVDPIVVEKTLSVPPDAPDDVKAVARLGVSNGLGLRMAELIKEGGSYKVDVYWIEEENGGIRLKLVVFPIGKHTQPATEEATEPIQPVSKRKGNNPKWFGFIDKVIALVIH